MHKGLLTTLEVAAEIVVASVAAVVVEEWWGGGDRFMFIDSSFCHFQRLSISSDALY